jgi:hypothetical protein
MILYRIQNLLQSFKFINFLSLILFDSYQYFQLNLRKVIQNFYENFPIIN